MATLVIPNTVQIVVEMACSGQQVINVLHFKTGVGTFTNGNEALAAHLDNGFGFWWRINGDAAHKGDWLV